VPTTARKAPDASIAYRQDVDDVIEALKSDARAGLTDGDAQARLERDGRNELTAETLSRRGDDSSRSFRT
jgi:Ca2+-transporting ATPase